MKRTSQWDHDADNQTKRAAPDNKTTSSCQLLPIVLVLSIMEKNVNEIMKYELRALKVKLYSAKRLSYYYRKNIVIQCVKTLMGQMLNIQISIPVISDKIGQYIEHHSTWGCIANLIQKGKQVKRKSIITRNEVYYWCTMT